MTASQLTRCQKHTRGESVWIRCCGRSVYFCLSLSNKAIEGWPAVIHLTTSLTDRLLRSLCFLYIPRPPVRAPISKQTICKPSPTNGAFVGQFQHKEPLALLQFVILCVFHTIEIWVSILGMNWYDEKYTLCQLISTHKGPRKQSFT